MKSNTMATATENARLSASLATRLRLTPSTRYDARQADRNSDALPDDYPRPWERRFLAGEEGDAQSHRFGV